MYVCMYVCMYVYVCIACIIYSYPPPSLSSYGVSNSPLGFRYMNDTRLFLSHRNLIS